MLLTVFNTCMVGDLHFTLQSRLVPLKALQIFQIRTITPLTLKKKKKDSGRMFKNDGRSHSDRRCAAGTTPGKLNLTRD